jgi:hypothetical protein
MSLLMRDAKRAPSQVSPAAIAARITKVIGLRAYPFTQGSATEGRNELRRRIRSETQRTGLEYSSEAGRLFRSGKTTRAVVAMTVEK